MLKDVLQILIGAICFFLAAYVLPEIVAWLFGVTSLIWIIIWPFTKLYKLKTGKDFW